MLATRTLLAASPIITHGRQLVSQLAGPGYVNVGPNAILRSGSYPPPASGSTGPLTSAASTLTGGFWRINNTPGSGQNTLPNMWASGPATAYAYSNSPSNLGGVTASAMLIDGYPVASGTYVFQFMDLSSGSLAFYSGGPPAMFRGCRIRGAIGSPGFFNSQSGGYASSLYLHYNDLGGAGSSSECDIAVQIGQSGNLRLLRNYISWVGTGIIVVVTNTFCDIIENMIEGVTLFNGTLHLNGIKLQGGDTNWLVRRNSVVFDQWDSLGNQITQTDCIGMIPTFGAFPGTGVNSDGSSGYVIDSNFVGGAGYCMYLGSNNLNSAVSNLAVINNQFTTAAYPAGGFNGEVTYPPPSGWGTSGNVKSGNTWADGPNAGQLVSM
jgi:hypothetical protein